MINLNHKDWCEFWLDQYPQECTCGLTAPKPVWIDALPESNTFFKLIKQHWKNLDEARKILETRENA